MFNELLKLRASGVESKQQLQAEAASKAPEPCAASMQDPSMQTSREIATACVALRKQVPNNGRVLGPALNKD